MPASVTEIGERAFQSCAKLTGVSGCYGVTKYGQYIFNINGTRLTGDYPDLSRVTSFGNGVFQFCKMMTGEVTLCPTLTAIPNRLFYRNSITKLRIPPSVTSIGELSLRDCQKLKALFVPGPATVSSGEQSTATVNAKELLYGSLVLKTVLFGQNTKGSNLTLGSMLTSVKGCTVFAPRSGWNGLVTGGTNNPIVYYGPGEELDLTVDAEYRRLTAVPTTANALSNVLAHAAIFKDEFDLDTRIAVTNSLSSAVTVSAEDLQNVTFVTYVTFTANTQAQLDATLAALPSAMPIVIDATGATETINVPEGRNVAVLVPGGGKYGPTRKGLVIVVK
ncbi:MAG: leucine-rich repeat domain-containing protein [Kiritimatiellae bacterium]|nr:leucine-rich repeat domain-containing protein [Kiritimatiellia bacterium]